MTDMMMASLVVMQGDGILVEFPDEPRTGADMEWNFVRRDPPCFFRVYVQAKRLYGDGKKWTRHAYRELFHISRGALQAVALADTARNGGPGCFPLYAFYNPKRTCELAADDGKNRVAGVNLADGYAIEALVKAATTQILRTRSKNLKTLYPLLFLLSDVFCPATTIPIRPMALVGSRRFVLDFSEGAARLGITAPPGPEMVRARLVAQRERLIDSLLLGGEGPFDGFPTVPEVANELPEDVQDILNRYHDGIPPSGRRALNRWRVTFVSRNGGYE